MAALDRGRPEDARGQAVPRVLADDQSRRKVCGVQRGAWGRAKSDGQETLHRLRGSLCGDGGNASAHVQKQGAGDKDVRSAVRMRVRVMLEMTILSFNAGILRSIRHLPRGKLALSQLVWSYVSRQELTATAIGFGRVGLE